MNYDSILLVDDDPEDRNIFAIALNDVAPLTKLTAMNNAVNALDALKTKTIVPDVIFVDLNMPVMNGQEFLVAIKRNTQLHSIPVVIFTTSAHKPTMDTMKDLGADEFITKPDTYNGLVDVIRSFLFPPGTEQGRKN